MINVLIELAFGVLLFLASLVLIPRLLAGDRKVYEIAVPFGATLAISILLTNNFNLSLLLATLVTIVIYYIRKRRM